jgi:ferritin
MNKALERGFNKQLHFELYSAYLYYAMANYCESISLPGAANWLRIQTMEETGHAAKFANFINERRGRVKLEKIDAPPVDWESPLAAFEEAYQHELKVSARINKLLDAALESSDHAAANFLQWFVAEQVEEEASADAVVQRFKLVDKSEGGLFMLDKELGSRAFTIPADLTGAGE